MRAFQSPCANKQQRYTASTSWLYRTTNAGLVTFIMPILLVTRRKRDKINPLSVLTIDREHRCIEEYENWNHNFVAHKKNYCSHQILRAVNMLLHLRRKTCSEDRPELIQGQKTRSHSFKLLQKLSKVPRFLRCGHKLEPFYIYFYRGQTRKTVQCYSGGTRNFHWGL